VNDPLNDYKSLPTWKRGMTLAHTVYAAVEAAGAKGTEAGTRLRKAAVSVPSLVGEAFLDLSGASLPEALGLAETKLAEVAHLLISERALAGMPEADRESLLADLSALRAELAQLRAERSGENPN
jgi:four helix bundle protein